MTRRRFVKIDGAFAATVATGGARGVSAPRASEAGTPPKTGEEGMQKILVVYGTKSGCTAGVAERIGKTLVERGATVDVVAANKAGSAANYGAVVVGSGVRMSRWHGPVRTWVGDHAGALKDKPVAFYTVGLRLVDPGKAQEVRAYTDPLVQQTGVKPTQLGLFAGWNVPKNFSLIERLILKAMKAPEGDFRDWATIDAWAAKIALPFP
jgi:menaquinone-dependent protoporphyrinogen oxidase